MTKLPILKSNLILTILSLFLTNFNSEAQIVNIPDPNFKFALISSPNNVDLNDNGQIEVSEAQSISVLNVSNWGIKSMKGIEAFISLTILSCSNNNITSLILSNNPNLRRLDCEGNDINILNIENNTLLTRLNCSYNNLDTLSITKNILLDTLDCESLKKNYFGIGKQIDFSKNTDLKFLNCSGSISSLNLDNNKNLIYLNCRAKNLEYLNVSKLPSLKILNINSNLLRSLDVSSLTNLEDLDASENGLEFVCINESQITKSQSWNNFRGYYIKPFEFRTNCATGIEDDLNIITSKKVDIIYNSLGQEVIKEDAKSGLFIYHYSDGSSRKLMLSE